MEFTRHVWKDGDKISAERLNAIEEQLEALTAAHNENADALATIKKSRTTRSRKAKAAADKAAE